jgi:dihydropteroate synthase
VGYGRQPEPWAVDYELSTRVLPLVFMKLYANLAGVDVGDAFPVRVMGVINVSPESFHPGSVVHGARALEKAARRMVAEGADLLDVGAMSTAPYVQGHIGEAAEARRMRTAVRIVSQVVSVPISADTQRSRVAAAAVEAGATIINDVSGLRTDAAMGEVARHAGGVVLMASEQGRSRTPPLALVRDLLRSCLARARRQRIPRERIVLDPGIGFFRRAALPWDALDCTVLHDLRALRRLGRPLLIGVSRKSFVGKITGRVLPAERLYGSLAATAIAVYNGAAIIRTHDVGPTVDTVRMAEAIRRRG